MYITLVSSLYYECQLTLDDAQWWTNVLHIAESTVKMRYKTFRKRT